MPRFLAALIIFIAGWAPTAVFALSLGDIDLKSALNQPFVAEIPVSTETADELIALRIDVASSDTFKQYGLDRAGFLGDFKFEIVGQGTSGLVRITSLEAVVEPFVTLLLEIRWPQGRLLREYTVLLDPPVFVAEQVAPAVQVPAAGPAPGASRVVRPETVQPESTPPAASRTASAPPVPGIPEGAYGPVKRTDTLWSIAGRYTSSAGVDRNQMMLAIYRANPEAFIGNINRLKAGMILRIPGAEELDQLGRKDATVEVVRQHEAWQSAVEDPARLRLVPPPDAADDTDVEFTGSAGTASDIESLRNEVGQLEEELAESRRLIELRDRELQALQQQAAASSESPPVPVEPADIEAEVTEPAVADPAAETPVVAPVEPEPAESVASRPEVVITTPEDEPSLIGGLITNVWFYVALGGVLILALFIVRRRATEPTTPPWTKFEEEDEPLAGEETAEATQQLSAHVQTAEQTMVVEEGVRGELTDEGQVPFRPEPDAVIPEFTGEIEEPETPLERTISTDSAVNLDEADPIAEADFHMAYGLYDQAADLLTNALNAGPEQKDLRLKLIEVYFIWENQGGFLREALELQSRLDDPSDPDWNKVLIMGKQICPDEELFAASPASPSDAEDMDFALGEDLTGMQNEAVDFAFSDEDDEGLDFDLGTEDGVAEESDSLDFTITEDYESATLDVTMESPIEPPSGEATMETPTIESPSLEATMESPIEPPPGEVTMETPTIESPTGDWGVESSGAEEVEAGSVDQTAEIDLGDLGLDLSALDDVIDGDEVDEDDSIDQVAVNLHAETLQLDAESLDVLDDDTLSRQIPEDSFIGEGEGEDGDLAGLIAADDTMMGEVIVDSAVEQPVFGDTAEQLAAGDTVEQPSIESETAEQPVLSGTSSLGAEALAEVGETSGGIDFDIGETYSDSDDTTSALPGPGNIDGATMTEVGTKLDLARAYIDMGDPDGARSILNEVLEEASNDQRQEAQKLLEDLAD